MFSVCSKPMASAPSLHTIPLTPQSGARENSYSRRNFDSFNFWSVVTANDVTHHRVPAPALAVAYDSNTARRDSPATRGSLSFVRRSQSGRCAVRHRVQLSVSPQDRRNRRSTDRSDVAGKICSQTNVCLVRMPRVHSPRRWIFVEACAHALWVCWTSCRSHRYGSRSTSGKQEVFCTLLARATSPAPWYFPLPPCGGCRKSSE